MTSRQDAMTPLRADYTLLLVRLGEVWLKGRNRGEFLGRLRRNLRASLEAAVPGARLRGRYARLFVELPDPSLAPAAVTVCADTPGLTSVSPVRRVESDEAAIVAEALALARAEWAGATGSFRVAARRSDKSFPLTSPEINRRVGGPLGRELGLTVNLKAADRELGVEVGEDGTLLWVHTFPAVGGLPVGSTGRVLLLLSGGIDSPVAGYLAQKRGCALDAVYFHSPPFISEASREKVEALARRLAPRQGGLRLHVVPFTDIQTAIRQRCEPRHTVLLYRRFMYRIAAALAGRIGADALCTGENLGQVASQTLENLALVDRLTDRLTLRPLLTHDKQETVEIARRIGTYELSIQPFDDCCTLFVPKHPTLRAPARVLEAQETRLDVDHLVRSALARTEVVDL